VTANLPIDRLLQTLRVHAPGVTDALLQLELFNTLDEFFSRTSAWREFSDITLRTDALDYDIDVPAGARMVRILAVLHNGIPVPSAQGDGITSSSLGTLLPELTFPDSDAEFAFSESDLVGGSGPFSYAIYVPDYITVTTPPTQDQTNFPLRVLMALSVSKDNLEQDPGDWVLPDWMYDMFFQDWLDGALGKLYAMPAKPWSNKELTLLHGRKFRQAMGQRKQEANRGFTYGQPGWRFPRSGGWVR
jgi:hypothetical protein